MAKRLSNRVRQVNIGCLDHNRVRILFNLHYSMERVSSVLFLLPVPNQLDKFRPMFPSELTTD